MKQYDFYKDSGVEWIGEVPSHWEVVHLKRILREHMQYGANEPAESDNILYPRYIRITDITENSELRPETFKSLEPSKAKDYLLDKGDVLFARSGATVGKTFLFNADIKACYAGYLIKASCNRRKMLPEYLYYYTLSGAYECWKNSVFVQSTIQNIGADKYQLMYIPVPSINEQNAMLSYLNKKCSEINKVISAQQKRITLLQELKQSVITHAVTKGLNPNVEMKDSGVEWIGKIPASWDVVHLKRILRERMQYGANEPAESDDTTYPRYIRITDITANGELRPETFKSLEPSKAKDYLLDKGDVLFARSGATVGKTFLFNADIKACYAGYLIKASCDKRRMLPEYLYYYTQSGAYECWKNSVFIQSTIQNIGADKYQMMYIPVPSKDEQKQIVEYTMRKSQIFDAAISKAQHQVELLQEYKQSLITEVVTGKRKIS